MQKRIVTLAIFLATTGVAAAAWAQGEPQAKDRELRVMSYNIKHGMTNGTCVQPPRPSPDCQLDLEASIDVIRALDPDIIGMQEIDRFWARSAYLDEPAEIAAALGMDHYCYAPNLDHAPDSHSIVQHQYGTLIVSRFPILECENMLLRRVGNTEQRGLLMALVNVRGVPLQFYNTHLHTVQADRLLQTADIAAVIDAAPDGPKVMVGDFNARSTFTTTVTEMLPIYARFLDTWREAPLSGEGNPNGFTSPARLVGNPTSRIDYVFVSPDVDSLGTFVPIDAQTRFAADHYPVVATVALPGSAVGIGRKQPTLPEVVEAEGNDGQDEEDKNE
jgi:endonuclease/exonuclease/phosphatase family metal-dependent hydrolase